MHHKPLGVPFKNDWLSWPLPHHLLPFMLIPPSISWFLFPLLSVVPTVCALSLYRHEHSSIFILAHLSFASFPLFPSLFLVLRPFVLPNKDAAAQSKHLCSLGLCKRTFIFTAGDSELHTNAVLFAPEHRVALSHFNQRSFSCSSCFSFCRWVQIACPRLSVDWGTAFSRPLLSPYEVHASYIHHLSLLKQREEISLHLPPGPHSAQHLRTYLCFE